MKTMINLACAAALANAADAPAPSPEQVAKTYAKTLVRVNDKPKQIGREFMELCRPAALQEPEKVYGLHFAHYTQYFRNDLAMEDGKKFPEGAIIVKEKLAAEGKGKDPRVEAIAGMIKRAKGSLPKTGDWEYFWYEGGRMRTINSQSCAGCHSGAKKDYVFTELAAK